MSWSKSILAASLTGASGAGGTLIYHHAVPWTWKEVLIKEGCYFLSANEEYKAVWSEHKTTLLEKITELKSVQQTFDKDQIKNWCESQLKNNYVKNSTSYANISNLCTSKGITTVKAILILSGYGDFIDDEESTKEKQDKEEDRDSLYKAAFGVYRYYPQFLIWINKFTREKPEESYNKETVSNNGGPALKGACEFELYKPYKEISDMNHYTQIYWWCKKLPYKTIEDLVKAKDESWELATSWQGKGAKWQNTPQIFERYGDNKKTKEEKIKEINDQKIQSLCTSFPGTKLSSNAAYIEMYLIVRYVCRKEKPKSKRVPQ